MKRANWKCSLAVGCGLSVASAGVCAANATLQQQQINLREYQATYDVAAQKYKPFGVTGTPAPTAQFPAQQSEFRVQFGGSCQPNTQLDRSELRYSGANVSHFHDWTGSNNLNQVTQNVPTSITAFANLADACNAELQRKIQSGATYNQLKSEPFQLWQAQWGQIKHALTCSDGSKHERRAWLKADVVCGPADVRALRRAEKKKAKILEATVTLTGAEMGMRTQNCPVQANLRFYVQTDFPTVVKYQVVTPTGQRSSKRTLQVSLDQGSYYEASTNIPFTIPQASGAGGNGLPAGTVAPGSGSLTVGSQGPGGLNGGSSSTHASGGSFQQLQPANLHSNAFRIEILKPKRFQTSSVGYTVECLASTTQTGPGAVTARPRNTHPNQPVNQLQNRSGNTPVIQPLPGTGGEKTIQSR